MLRKEQENSSASALVLKKQLLSVSGALVFIEKGLITVLLTILFVMLDMVTPVPDVNDESTLRLQRATSRWKELTGLGTTAQTPSIVTE